MFHRVLGAARIGVPLGIAVLFFSELAVADSPAAVGGGRIGPQPVLGRTLSSPSDFGFYADSNGGTFVCSMAGPGTGGFAGTEIMMVQGIVIPGSLTFSGNTARFNCKGSIVMVPGPDGAPLKLPPASPPPAVIVRNAPFSVEVTAGGSGVGSLILKTHLRDFLGGDTGGFIAFGEVRFQ